MVVVVLSFSLVVISGFLCVAVHSNDERETIHVLNSSNSFLNMHIQYYLLYNEHHTTPIIISTTTLAFHGFFTDWPCFELILDIHINHTHSVCIQKHFPKANHKTHQKNIFSHLFIEYLVKKK